MSESIWSKLLSKTREEMKDLHLKPMPTSSTLSPLVPNEVYVSVRLRRLHVQFSRRWMRRYYGCVHSEIKVLDQRYGEVCFHTVSTPRNWMQTSTSNLDLILVQDVFLLRNVPYRGPLSIQLALLSIPMENGDLAAPYINLLQELASAAGVGMVQTAMVFAQPIRAGIDFLLDARSTVDLKLGLELQSLDMAGTYLLVQAPSEKAKDFKVNGEFKLVDERGIELKEYPYLVFSVEASGQRLDYMNIPDIKQAQEELKKQITSNNLLRARSEAMPAFKLACIMSPDLISSDADYLIKCQEEKMNKVDEAQKVSGTKLTGWDLEDLDLYGGGRVQKNNSSRVRK